MNTINLLNFWFFLRFPKIHNLLRVRFPAGVERVRIPIDVTFNKKKYVASAVDKSSCRPGSTRDEA